MASGCAVSVAGGSKWLLQFKSQDAREGLAISRLPPLRPSTSLPPSLLLRLARTPDRCRLFTVAAQDSNPRQQQLQELDVSVLRFTFGIPGLDESYLPRYIGIAFGFLIILNHVFSASPATPAQLRTEALGMCLAAFSTALPYLFRPKFYVENPCSKLYNLNGVDLQFTFSKRFDESVSDTSQPQAGV
ncbi:protein COFACTOR ASSEMBLY OF COMPLEX C SUBUNIT B CCB2, chloroplastic-like [Musa acuminata AAA Group]|uniref:protein COFACTOR ASSEMBLY OF COMPLEX C SUBUNIT B CCB2, chloroplastic-like n=1 Tax=Musa acuminata AAA Group TaxID=214697 RepID=UPI0031DEB742